MNWAMNATVQGKLGNELGNECYSTGGVRQKIRQGMPQYRGNQAISLSPDKLTVHSASSGDIEFGNQAMSRTHQLSHGVGNGYRLCARSKSYSQNCIVQKQLGDQSVLVLVLSFPAEGGVFSDISATVPVTDSDSTG